jgi:hypothetical protein
LPQRRQRAQHLDEQLRSYSLEPKTNFNLAEIAFALGYIGGTRNTACLVTLLPGSGASREESHKKSLKIRVLVQRNLQQSIIFSKRHLRHSVA